jgi:hypothetical protein
MEISMPNEMYVDIEKIIEKHAENNEELQQLIVNEGDVVFKEGDVVSCSYTQNKLYEVISIMPDHGPCFKGKVAVYDFEKKLRTTIGEKFLQKVKVNKEAMKILYKS